jgi:hypothetical protein
MLESMAMARWRAALTTSSALAIAAAAPGCAFFASANAAHSRITPCVDSPTFALIDLGIATVGTVGLLASGTAEEAPAWLAAPGVFLLSGVVGSITAYQCRHRHDGVATAAPSGYPPAYGTASPSGEAPATPASPPSPPVELALPPRDPPMPKARLQLDPDYLDQGAGPAAAPKANERIECSIQPLIACPPDHSCVLLDGTRGYCRPDR